MGSSRATNLAGSLVSVPSRDSTWRLSTYPELRKTCDSLGIRYLRYIRSSVVIRVTPGEDSQWVKEGEVITAHPGGCHGDEADTRSMQPKERRAMRGSPLWASALVRSRGPTLSATAVGLPDVGQCTEWRSLIGSSSGMEVRTSREV